MTNPLMIEALALTPDQAAGLIKIVQQTEFPGAAAPAVLALQLSLSRIVEGADVVVAAPTTNEEKAQ